MRTLIAAAVQRLIHKANASADGIIGGEIVGGITGHGVGAGVRPHTIAPGLSAALASALLATTTFSFAQSATAAIKSYEIEAQPISSALKAFAEQSSLQLIFTESDVASDTTAGVRGDLAPTAALDAILLGTHLEYEITASNVVVVRKIGANSATGTGANGQGGAVGVGSSGQTGSKGIGSTKISYSRGASGNLRLAQMESSGSTGQDGNKESTEGVKLEEIVVTAQKREENLQNVPISIGVLSGEFLDSSPTVSLTAALNAVPGVSATTNAQGGGTSIAIRGVTASGPIFSGSSPIGYYVDSVPYGLVNNAIGPDFNAYDLLRVEVLRGPQGTLYGANSENGLVRLLTNDADLDDYEVKSRVSGSHTDTGGAGNYRADLAVNVPIVEGKLAARAVVGYQSLSGWIRSDGSNHMNDALLRNYRLKIGAQPTEQLSVTLSAWRSKNDYDAPSISDDDNFFPGSIPSPVESTTDTYGLKLVYDAPVFTFSSMTGYLEFANDGKLSLVPLGAQVALRTDMSARVVSQEFILNSAASSAWTWTVGAFYRDAQDLRYQEGPGVLPAPISITSGSESVAGYGQIGHRFANDRLEWTLGGRYFHDQTLNRENLPAADNSPLYSASPSFHAFTPKAVLTWYPSENLTMYGSYSQGFRSGFAQEGTVFRTAPSIPPAKPDKLNNYEIGAKGDVLDRRLSFDASVYYIYWRDVIQPLLLPIPGSTLAVSALANGKSASGLGAGLALTARPTASLSAGIKVDWNDLALDSAIFGVGEQVFAKGDRLNYSPESTLGAFADYSFPLGGSGFRGQFAASANYISKVIVHGYNRRAFTGIGESILNVRSSFTLVSPQGWTATLFGENLTNCIGDTPLFSNLVPAFSTRQRPRTYGLQLEYRFSKSAQ